MSEHRAPHDELIAGAKRAHRALGPDAAALERMFAGIEAQVNPAAPAPRSWLRYALVAGGVATLALVYTLRRPGEPAPAPVVPAAPAAAPVEAATPPLVVDATAPPAPTVEPAPVQARARPPARPRAEEPDPVAELAILTRARRVLASDPARTLALSDQHLARFPRGSLREERELLAIEALAALARSPQRSARARAFLRDFPGSVHIARVRELDQGRD